MFGSRNKQVGKSELPDSTVPRPFRHRGRFLQFSEPALFHPSSAWLILERVHSPTVGTWALGLATAAILYHIVVKVWAWKSGKPESQDILFTTCETCDPVSVSLNLFNYKMWPNRTMYLLELWGLKEPHGRALSMWPGLSQTVKCDYLFYW